MCEAEPNPGAREGETMKTLHIAAIGLAIGVASLGSVQAQSEPEILYRQTVEASTLPAYPLYGEDSGSFRLSMTMPHSTLTRAEVDDALRQARLSGEYGMWAQEDSGALRLAQADWTSTLTRAEVEGQVLQARAAGELDVLVGEDSGSFYFARGGGRQATAGLPGFGAIIAALF